MGKWDSGEDDDDFGSDLVLPSGRSTLSLQSSTFSQATHSTSATSVTSGDDRDATIKLGSGVKISSFSEHGSARPGDVHLGSSADDDWDNDFAEPAQPMRAPVLMAPPSEPRSLRHKSSKHALAQGAEPIRLRTRSSTAQLRARAISQADVPPVPTLQHDRKGSSKQASQAEVDFILPSTLERISLSPRLSMRGSSPRSSKVERTRQQSSKSAQSHQTDDSEASFFDDLELPDYLGGAHTPPTSEHPSSAPQSAKKPHYGDLQRVLDDRIKSRARFEEDAEQHASPRHQTLRKISKTYADVPDLPIEDDFDLDEDKLVLTRKMSRMRLSDATTPRRPAVKPDLFIPPAPIETRLPSSRSSKNLLTSTASSARLASKAKEQAIPAVEGEVAPARTLRHKKSLGALPTSGGAVKQLRSKRSMPALPSFDPAAFAAMPPVPAVPKATISTTRAKAPPNSEALRRPKRTRQYGDGTELDGLADLDIDADQERKLLVRPSSSKRLAELGAKARQGSPGRAEAKSEKRPRKSRGKEPHLIRNLTAAGLSKVQGQMTWNPIEMRWDGNEGVLRDFDHIGTASARPALIAPGASISRTGKGSVRVVGNMVFDPLSMSWHSSAPEEEEDIDWGADLADDEAGFKSSAKLSQWSTTSAGSSSLSTSVLKAHSGDDLAKASLAADKRHRDEMRPWQFQHAGSTREDRSVLWHIRKIVMDI
ncbi:uncharacterized protein L969DRAFT_97444 [Mixia osmundae IAM 14324]|uniref:Uncharacterized protein n=1 Tax=Mixia osmundae (strain CBS 9802 / IAM 14324 / JCM 22182 / KY 12970) TaxID=764103 RepID=G7E4I2_MIXOS|nr:uncharacterized protein L969DRAFT_97444 [Mixia osmundae IAM 14324]KEI36241.1 hypothetical protein L969DRAFT_97444 [Mixia osmundae IAM 14324]GAA97742.1 hypothetical protein E5Q_04421 [Mixia osmundae IAM 14324]